MTVLSIPTLSSHQLSLALDILDIREFAFKESLQHLDELAANGEFSQAQLKAPRELIKTLGEQEEGPGLGDRWGRDEESLEVLRERVVHEARAAYVR